MHVRTGDNVEVLTGRDRGRRGKVLRVLREKDRVVIEKLNLIKKHQKPTQRNPVGGIVEKEAPMHVSNVQLVCPRCDRPRRFSRAVSDAGRKVRACRKCGERVEAAA